MIVVVGSPAWQPGPSSGETSGTVVGPAVSIARAAVDAGARVELVGKVGEDPTGDALLIELARAGVGHIALLRDPGAPTHVAAQPPAAIGGASLDATPAALLVGDQETERPTNGRSQAAAAAPARLVLDAADVELALRYLVEFRVIVVAEALAQAALRVVVDAAAFTGAQIVAVAAEPGAAALPADATVLEAPADDPDGEFGRLVGEYAAALDRGEAAGPAFRELVAERGWETAG